MRIRVEHGSLVEQTSRLQADFTNYIRIEKQSSIVALKVFKHTFWLMYLRALSCLYANSKTPSSGSSHLNKKTQQRTRGQEIYTSTRVRLPWWRSHSVRAGVEAKGCWAC